MKSPSRRQLFWVWAGRVTEVLLGIVAIMMIVLCAGVWLVVGNDDYADDSERDAAPGPDEWHRVGDAADVRALPLNWRWLMMGEMSNVGDMMWLDGRLQPVPVDVYADGPVEITESGRYARSME
jgi:hypothetical protein